MKGALAQTLDTAAEVTGCELSKSLASCHVGRSMPHPGMIFYTVSPASCADIKSVEREA